MWQGSTVPLLLHYDDVARDNRHSALHGLDAFRALASQALETQAAAFATTVLRNTRVKAVLERLALLDLPPWYLTAGALFQSVWNAASGADDLAAGIRDLDLFFYDGDDLSYEAEDVVIKRCLAACADIDVELEPRNEARVHIWYPDKFGKTIDQYRDLEHAISSFAATCCCVALSLDPGGKLAVHATHGFDDLFTLTLRPNPSGIAPRAVYEDKSQRWMTVWPDLTKLPWPEGFE